VAPGTYLTLRAGRRVKVDAQVTYRDAAGAVLATNHLSGERVWTNCGDISGYGAFCFRRTHAIEFRLRDSENYEWRGWAKLECLLNSAPTNCNYWHLKFAVGAQGEGIIASKDWPDELNKPVALYGGTFRPDVWVASSEYLQQAGFITNPTYYARHVASGYRTVSRYGCSHWVDFSTGDHRGPSDHRMHPLGSRARQSSVRGRSIPAGAGAPFRVQAPQSIVVTEHQPASTPSRRVAARSGLDCRRSRRGPKARKNAAVPLNQSREAHLAARPLHSA
jgi:hypothetical protein